MITIVWVDGYGANTAVTIGEDVELRFKVLSDDRSACVDVSTWALSFHVKRSAASAADPVIEKATGGAGITVSGVFDASPSTNAQRVIVAIADEDTDELPPRLYECELKRMDDGYETVLARGTFPLVRGVHRV